VVLVVLDTPRLKGEHERHEGERADDVLQQLVGGEGAVPTVVANDKKLWWFRGGWGGKTARFGSNVGGSRAFFLLLLPPNQLQAILPYCAAPD
jgi:hypothetical protein